MLPHGYKPALYASVAALALTQITPSFAQEATTKLEDIVLSLGKEKVAIETPMAVTVISQEEIDAEQATTIGEVLENVPGVATINPDAPLGQSFNIRGIGAALAADENRMILQVDGVKKFFEQYRMGSFFADPELYKSVEVLRGPAGSTLYGAGAMAGVIAIETKDASDFLEDGKSIGGRIKGNWSSNGNSFNTSALVAAKIGEDLEFLSSLNFGRQFAYKGGGDSVAADEGATNVYAGLAKLKYTFGEDKDQSLTASYERSQYNADDQIYDRTQLLSGMATADRSARNESAVLKYENSFNGNDLLDVSVQLAYSKEKTRQSDLKEIRHWRGHMYKPFGDETEYAYTTWQGKIENRSDITELSMPAYLTYGLEFVEQERLNPRYSAAGVAPGSSSHPEGESLTLGTYAQAEIEVLPDLVLTPGVRLDYSSITPGKGVKAKEGPSDVAFSPKLAAYYDLTDNLGLFGSFAHTERMPSIDEALGGANYTADSISQIKKETSDNIEGGVALSFNDLWMEQDALRVKTTVYHNTIRNHLVAYYDHASNRAMFEHMNRATYYGVELEASYNSPTIFAEAGLSYTKAKNHDKNLVIDSAPPLNGFVSVGYNFAEYDLRAKWRSKFFAAKTEFDNPDFKAGAYSLHSASLDWKPSEGTFAGVELRASIDNIFDKKVVTPGTGRVLKGREFKLTLAKQF